MPGPPLDLSQDIGVRGALTARARLRRTSTVSLSLAVDSDNLAPLGIAVASTLLVTCTNAGAKITGLVAGQLGDEITIRAEYNSLAFVLRARDSASTSTNWFSLARDLVIQPYQSVTFRYQLVASGGPAWVPTDDRYGTAAPLNVPASGNAASNEVVKGDDARLGIGNRVQIPFFAGVVSAKTDSGSKRSIGSINIDPTLAAWGTSVTSTITLYALLEVTNATFVAHAELYQETGTGSPGIIAATSTTSATTPTLVSVNVSTAFRPATGHAGLYSVRIWISTADGTNQVTCREAYLEIIP